MTVHTTTPARAARRQNTCDRIAEYLTEKGAQPERAAAWAPEILELVVKQGYALPAVLEDSPPPRPLRQADPHVVADRMAGIRAVLAQPTGTRAQTCALCLQLTERHEGDVCPPPP